MATSWQDFFLGNPSELEALIENDLQPTRKYNRVSKQLIDKLVQYLQHLDGYSVNRIIKGGSFGKGTQVKGLADLDCVMILNDLDDLEDYKARKEDIKKDLLQRLQNDPEWNGIIENAHLGRFCVTFDVIVEDTGEKMEVDLIPMFDELGENPTKDDIKAFHEKLLGSRVSEIDIEHYGMSVTQLQRDFIRDHVPPRVKDLIRLVKYWKDLVMDEIIPKGLRNPKCYQLELIAFFAWERAGNPGHFDMARAFKAVLHQVVYYKDLDVAWYHHYSKDMARRAKKHMNKPILLSPGIPSCNTFTGTDPEAWEHAAQIAKQTMDSPLLKDVDIPNEWLGTRKYVEGTVPCWCL